MKNKTLYLLSAIILSGNCIAQIKNKKTVTAHVDGNCGTCKKNIETAAYSKKISSAVWNEDQKTAVLTYDSTKTTSDAILKRIALAGYDNQNYIAPQSAYTKLNPCCQYERKRSSKTLGGQMNEQTAMNTDSNTGQQQDTVKKNTQTAENPLSLVYAAYFGIKDALVADDANTAAIKAQELFKAVEDVPMEKLPMDQHMTWMKYMKDISSGAEQIKATTKVEKQRVYFAKLSAPMTEIIKVIKSGYPVYIDHCPMYNNGKGADWLSKDGDIKNPYYGSQMLGCGNVKETILK